MKVHEYQAREIYKQYGIAVSEGYVAETADQAHELAAKIDAPVVIKAQVHVGGRGKAGGVKVVQKLEDVKGVAEKILGMEIKGLPVKKVGVVRAVDIDHEYYLGVTLDRENRRPVILVSREGGVDIEEVAAKTPEKIGRSAIDPLIGVEPYVVRKALYSGGFTAEEVKGITPILVKLCKCYLDMDAQLAEINPLVRTADGEFMAIDAKIDFDDSAMFRHKELDAFKEESETDALESEAHALGLAYVRLSGEVGVIGNGAGLVMATLDMAAAAGRKPANFLDIGGGARADVVANSLSILLKDPNVKGILINVFGGITRCDEVAKGIIEGAGKLDINVPMVIRLKGTNEKEGKDLLEKEGYTFSDSGMEAARKIVELIGAA
jgi:succinyl-CoA synthetase beta subunit